MRYRFGCLSSRPRTSTCRPGPLAARPPARWGRVRGNAAHAPRRTSLPKFSSNLSSFSITAPQPAAQRCRRSAPPLSAAAQRGAAGARRTVRVAAVGAELHVEVREALRYGLLDPAATRVDAARGLVLRPLLVLPVRKALKGPTRLKGPEGREGLRRWVRTASRMAFL